MKKKILFITSTHGDEGFSIKILNELEKKYSKDKYGYDRIIGNPKALKLNVRQIDGNLNRLAPGKATSEIYEERRAFEIMKITKKFDFTIDIHGSDSECGVVIIICNPILPNLALAGLFDIGKIVVWSTKEDYKTGPLTQFCKSGLEIECGKKNNPLIQRKLKKVLGKFIRNYQNMTVTEIMRSLRKKEIYAIYDKAPGKDKSLRDFVKATRENETFYPFMSNIYPETACYKMRKIDLSKIFLSQSKI